MEWQNCVSSSRIVVGADVPGFSCRLSSSRIVDIAVADVVDVAVADVAG